MPPCLTPRRHALRLQAHPCNLVHQVPAGPLFWRIAKVRSSGVHCTRSLDRNRSRYPSPACWIRGTTSLKTWCSSLSNIPSHGTSRHMKIGIWDSGIGGLSVASAVQDVLPGVKIHYIADTAYFPYGGQSQEILVRRALYMSHSLVSEGCELVVVACNTASSAALEHIRASVQVPCVGVEPAVKPAVQMSRSKHIVVLATQQTAAGSRLAALIKNHAHGARVSVLPMPGLADMVEAGQISGPVVTSMLWSQLAGPISEGADTVVLGCTHYAFLRDVLAKVLPEGVAVLDAARPVANRVRFLLYNAVKSDSLHVQSLTDGIVEGTESYVDLEVTGKQVLVEKVLDQLSSKGAKLPRRVLFRTCSSRT